MPTDHAPLLSLCLATYNRAAYLDRYLTHHLEAFETAGVDYELVVSDNCSTDETPEILARYAERYPRMRVSRQHRNVGAYPNILTTLHQARGKVVVSIADDDVAVIEPLLRYVRRIAEDETLVMIQAPWLQTDETREHAVIGQFYELDGESRFRQGDYGPCLGFVLQHHVFPECWIMRRSVLPSVAGPAPRFVYGFFSMLATALTKGDVLFCPEPHIAATAISRTTHAGNTEAMEAWDSYRGGLEWLASFARQSNPAALADPQTVAWAIHAFVVERMAVAAKLQAHAGHWSNAYQILRRVHAYGVKPSIGVDYNDVAVLAAIETALVESVQRGASEIVLGDSVPDHALERMKPPEGVRMIRSPDAAPGDLKRAYLSVGAVPDASMRPQDFAVDVVAAMDRFPLFQAQS